MALIKIVDPEKAEGEVKEIYDAMQKNIGMIPSPMQLASASPQMMKMMWQSIQYYTQHPNLGFGLLSTIRFLVAEEYDYCDAQQTVPALVCSGSVFVLSLITRQDRQP